MDAEQYLDRPVDHSAEFTRRVADLGEQVSRALGAPVRQDSDMNYNPGQLLVVHLDAAGRPTGSDTDAAWAATVAVSSRGPLWALLAGRAGAGPRVWVSTATAELEDGPGAAAVGAITAVMTAAGLQRVPDADLDRLVPGRVTEMDGLPATVRDALFCEVC
jgi:hypothetical protein